MTTIRRERAPEGMPAPLSPSPARPLAPAPVEVHHDRLDEHHLDAARLLRDALRRTAGVPPTARDDLALAVRQADLQLRGARYRALAIEEELHGSARRATARPIRLLSAAHLEARRHLAAAEALLTAPCVDLELVRGALARLFAAIGRADQAHYYLRHARAAAA